MLSIMCFMVPISVHTFTENSITTQDILFVYSTNLYTQCNSTIQHMNKYNTKL